MVVERGKGPGPCGACPGQLLDKSLGVEGPMRPATSVEGGGIGHGVELHAIVTREMK